MVRPIIEFRNVEKSFGDVKVLDKLSFCVAPSQHLALIGLSGSGKTTILRILMTLEDITAGDVLIDGTSINFEDKHGMLVPASDKHIRRLRADIGMVFQHFNLFPHKTALENVTLAPVLTARMSRLEAAERAIQLLRKVGLEAQSE